MAEAISLASGVLALTTFAIQSTKTLFDVVESFRNKARTVRELKEELEALEQVLLSLQAIQNDPEIDLSTLKLPLLRCGQACEGFAELVQRCTSGSNKDKSFRTWMMLTYRGRDIISFRNLIGVYKSTIAIALADANIRHVNITVQLLRQYKEMIANTTTDLQDMLEQSSEGVSHDSQEGDLVVTTNAIVAGPSAVEEEKASIEHCLGVCAQVAHHLEQVQAEILGQVGPGASDHQIAVNDGRSSSARSVTSKKLQDCKTGLGITASELRVQLQDADHRLSRLLRDSNGEHGVGGDSSQNPSPGTVEELRSIRQCLSICEQAADEVMKERTNVFEDVHMLDDAHQVIVATLGDLISSKRISTGARSSQWLGQMSDDSLQQLSRDNVTKRRATGAPLTNEIRGTSSGIPEHNSTSGEPQVTIHPRFESRHGPGQTLR